MKASVLKNDFLTGIKPDAKEMYLSDEEFFEIFGMDKTSWKQIKLWRRNLKKKEIGLF